MTDEEVLKVVEALAVAIELCGVQWTDRATLAVVEELKRHPVDAVLTALGRCARELKGRLTLADIVERIAAEDGRPTADEAWAHVGTIDESRTLVATEEAYRAMTIAAPLLRDGDTFAARRAFVPAYEAAVRDARARGERVRWRVSPGTDPHSRRSQVQLGLERGQLTPEQARDVCGELGAPQRPQLTDGKEYVGVEQIRALLAALGGEKKLR